MDYETALDTIFSISEEILAYEEAHMEFKTSRLVQRMVRTAEAIDADSLEKLEERADVYDMAGGSSYLSSRRKLAAKYYEKAFDCECAAFEKYNGSEDAVLDRLYNAVVARNNIADDECTDLKSRAKKYVSSDKVNSVVKEAIRTGRDRYLYDKVELTQEYLDVIDKVEERVYNHLCNESGGKLDVKKMFPHRYWREKKRFLKAAGIDWKTPAEMNPGTRF